MNHISAYSTVRANADNAAAHLYTLIAVTKRRTSEEILPLLHAGHRDFGENIYQEAQEKWPALRNQFPDIKLHFIGKMQRNKVKHIMSLADVLHSVDSVKIIEAVASVSERIDRNPECFLQVNIGQEPQKSGCAPEDVPALLKHADDSGVLIKGLMCIPPADHAPRPFFSTLATLANNAGLPALSMGMSGDYKEALREGATHIRVGSALFAPAE